jgi:pSer/pThr/pTyr-binding forkhead associated (FHA) protein
MGDHARRAAACGGTIARVAEHVHSSSAKSARDLKAQIEAERAGVPFLVYRDGEDNQRIRVLDDARAQVTVGRSAATDIELDWDTEVSRIHAELECIGGAWTVSDDGLSRNGTHVNGERIVARQRLRDRDVIRFGHTLVVFRRPTATMLQETELAEDGLERVNLSDAQRRVLLALCRPFKEATGYDTPATNQQIAGELFLSVDAVKTHLRALFAKFGIEHLPQNRKRIRLVELALRSGLVTPRDL